MSWGNLLSKEAAPKAKPLGEGRLKEPSRHYTKQLAVVCNF